MRCDPSAVESRNRSGARRPGMRGPTRLEVTAYGCLLSHLTRFTGHHRGGPSFRAADSCHALVVRYRGERGKGCEGTAMANAERRVHGGGPRIRGERQGALPGTRAGHGRTRTGEGQQRPASALCPAAGRPGATNPKLLYPRYLCMTEGCLEPIMRGHRAPGVSAKPRKDWKYV